MIRLRPDSERWHTKSAVSAAATAFLSINARTLATGAIAICGC